jgi:hypothetical protein
MLLLLEVTAKQRKKKGELPKLACKSCPPAMSIEGPTNEATSLTHWQVYNGDGAWVESVPTRKRNAR